MVFLLFCPLALLYSVHQVRNVLKTEGFCLLGGSGLGEAMGGFVTAALWCTQQPAPRGAPRLWLRAWGAGGCLLKLEGFWLPQLPSVLRKSARSSCFLQVENMRFPVPHTSLLPSFLGSAVCLGSGCAPAPGIWKQQKPGRFGSSSCTQTFCPYPRTSRLRGVWSLGPKGHEGWHAEFWLCFYPDQPSMYLPEEA